MVVATCLVALLPLVTVWELRAHGVITSAWVGIPLAVLLSLLASVVGSAYWQRHRSTGDVMFSELLLWGWLRRLYVDHRVDNAIRQLGLGRGGAGTRDHPATQDQRARALKQLAVALDGQDVYTDGHSRRVARHATMTARKMGLAREEVARIQLAALVHDVGKLRVPRQVLNKPSQLTSTEFQIVKRHPEHGADMVACLGDPELAAIVRHHHERLDGSGYPDGLRGEEIPLGARIVAVVDMFDAITAPRPYRPAQPHRKAFDTLARESGTHLDPTVVATFRSCYSGKGPLAWWMTVGALLEGLAWPQSANAARIRPSAREILSTTATTIAVATVAVAAPISPQHAARRHRSPLAAAAVTRGPVPARHLALRAPAHGAKTNAGAPTLPLGRSAARSSAQRGPAGHRTVVAPAAPQPRPATRTTPTHAQPVAPPSRRPSTPPAGGPGRPSPAPANPPSTPITGGPSSPSPAPVNPPSTPPTGLSNPVTTSSPPTTPTTPPAVMPTSKAQCWNNGYARYGFKNQGQCIAFVEPQS